jgi:hypothetical protein
VPTSVRSVSSSPRPTWRPVKSVSVVTVIVWRDRDRVLAHRARSGCRGRRGQPCRPAVDWELEELVAVSRPVVLSQSPWSAIARRCPDAAETSARCCRAPTPPSCRRAASGTTHPLAAPRPASRMNESISCGGSQSARIGGEIEHQALPELHACRSGGEADRQARPLRRCRLPRRLHGCCSPGSTRTPRDTPPERLIRLAEGELRR